MYNHSGEVSLSFLAFRFFLSLSCYSWHRFLAGCSKWTCRCLPQVVWRRIGTQPKTRHPREDKIPGFRSIHSSTWNVSLLAENSWPSPNLGSTGCCLGGPHSGRGTTGREDTTEILLSNTRWDYLKKTIHCINGGSPPHCKKVGRYKPRINISSKSLYWTPVPSLFSSFCVYPEAYEHWETCV